MMSRPLVYLDNSATSYPKPAAVREAVRFSLIKYGANPGRGAYPMSSASSAAIYSVRQRAAEFFSAGGADQVAFMPSCTAALNAVIFGKLSHGDHAVISDMEHNAVMRPVKYLSGNGVSFSEAKVFESEPERTMASFRSAIRENTKLIICTAGSNVFGVMPPVSRLSALAHLYGAEICVDAAQAAGIVNIDMEKMGIDYLCLPSHKGLMGPMGAGMLISPKLSSLKPLIYGGTGTAGYYQPEEGPERFESGTLNVPGIVGMGAGISYISGIKDIYAKELKKAQYIYDGLSSIRGVSLYTGRPEPGSHLPVISFNFSSPCEEAAEYFGARNIALRAGLHCAPAAHKKYGTDSGTVRVLPSLFIKKEELDLFLRTAAEYSRK